MSAPPGLAGAILRYGEAPGGAAGAPVPWWGFTNSVLAAAALTLVAKGKLALDADVGETGFTLRELLQHRAGLRCYESCRDYHKAVAAAEPPWAPGDMWDKARADELLFAPGGGWFQSHIGYWIVRRLIERASGLELEPALRALIFRPLALEGPRLAATAADLSRTLWGNPRGYDPGWVYPGLVIGHPEDAAACLGGILWSDLLPDHLRREMREPHVLGGAWPGRPWAEPGYGLGLMAGWTAGARLAAGHTGHGAGSGGAVYTYPDDDTRTVSAVFAASEDEAALEAACFERLDAALANPVAPHDTTAPPPEGDAP